MTTIGTLDVYNGKKIKRIEYVMKWDMNPTSIKIIFEDEDREGSVYADTPELEVFAFYNSDRQEIEVELAGTETNTNFKYGVDVPDFDGRKYFTST